MENETKTTDVLSEALVKSEPSVGGVTTNKLMSLVSLMCTSIRSSVIGCSAWPWPMVWPWPKENQGFKCETKFNKTH